MQEDTKTPSEKHSQPSTPTVDKSTNSRRSRKWLMLPFIIVLLAGTNAGAYWMGARSSKPGQSTVKNSSQPSVTAVQGWAKPVSAHKGYPVNYLNSNNDKPLLRLYSFAQQKTVTLDKYEITYGGGTIWQGSSDPVASPDLLYTAFISKDENLWLLSNETLEATRITESGYVTYITDWSPDSKKIVYYSEQDAISTRGRGHGPSEPKQTFKPQREVGFYMFNIEDGTSTPLSPVEFVDSFIDNDRLLIKAMHEGDIPAIFNTKTFESDESAIQGSFGFGTGQYDFPTDGSKWTHITSRNPTADMNIVMGNFPGAASTTIDSGGWADVQRPHFSPDGTKIAYQKTEGQISPGVPKTATYVYDVASGKKTRYDANFAERWADNNTLIVAIFQSTGSQRESLSLLDLTTGELTVMHRY